MSSSSRPASRARASTSSQTFQSAHAGPARQQRHDDRPARATTVDLDATYRVACPTRSRRSRPTASTSPVAQAGGLHARTASASSSPGETRPTSRRPTTRSSPRSSDNADLAQPQERPGRRRTPEVQVTVDPNKAIMVGLTAAQVAGQVRGALVGPVATHVVQSATTDRRSDVVVQLDPDGRRPRSTTSRRCPSAPSPRCRSGSIATVEQVDVQGSDHPDRPGARGVHHRRDRERRHGRRLARRSRPRSTTLAADRRDPGRRRRPSWPASRQQQSEAFGGLFVSMGVAILLVYVVMVLTFNSLITPFIILFSLPLATIGAFPALFLTGPADRRQRPHRLPDAHRHRGHQRDRPARPRRTAALARGIRPTTPSSRAAGPACGRS